MILLRLSPERDEAPIVAEALGPDPVGPCLKTSLPLQGRFSVASGLELTIRQRVLDLETTVFKQIMRSGKDNIRLNTHTWDAIVGAGAFGEQPVPDLPCEDGGALPFEVGDLGHDVWGGHPRLTASDGPGTDGTCLVVPAQDFRDATV
ncbi:hypothetical protein TNCV_4542551 [Trichonephila clavipes]|nr:hypothetical protein TNCV_4542551 [Trichonephila clavipes]